MKVFKFGGASVNSAAAVRNMASIVRSHLSNEPLVVVVSAMGKTTNLLERIVVDDDQALCKQLVDYHLHIVRELMPDDTEAEQQIATMIAQHLAGTTDRVGEDYAFRYDQVVSLGELVSSTIVARFLNQIGIECEWLDARQLVFTDQHYREGRVDWERTRQAVNERLTQGAQSPKVYLTQGFIGGTPDGHTTTLGREGSDYSAAILAHCLNAESVTIWKDVPGFLNADPKFFAHTVKIDHIPYNEAIELAYYGASVIHPKTVKPLQNKGIPLYVRSFVEPTAVGSAIGDFDSISPETPLYIFRRRQILLSILPRDFSFIAEDNLQHIFEALSEVGVRVNLMQNSALSFSICVDDNPQLIPSLVERLGKLFRVRYNAGLQLITVRYYTSDVIENIVDGRRILLEQRSRLTAQIVVEEGEAQS